MEFISKPCYTFCGDIMKKIIFHVDVNNAFLSWTAIYLLNNGYDKDIRKIPSIIAGEEKRHGIVLAKSPIAKQYGIVSAETIYSAKRKCKNLEVYPPQYDFYVEMSNKFYNYLKEYTPLIEKASIDECFLDLTNTKYLYDDIMSLAYKIKNEIKEKFGFTVNIGIGNNKLCAKMASDFLKPDRVHTLFMEEVKDKMWPLDINDLLFVGKSSANILRSIGINTIGELANTNPDLLRKYFKNRVDDLIKSANGIDDSPVTINNSLNKCISISRTLMEDTNDLNLLKKILLNMSDSVGLRARKKGLYASNIAITFKTSSFKSFSHQEKINNPTNNIMAIYHKVLSLYDMIDKKEKIRNIGIRLGELKLNRNEQVSLFDKKENDSLQKLIDNINSKYDNSVIMPAIFFEEKK